MKTILEVSNLSKNFGYIKAVNNLSFKIEKGSVYGLLGPNGSGKSTTLGIILNVVNATSGSFSWFGGNLSTHQALKKVGAIIERPNFYPFMSAAENLRLVCKIKGVATNEIQKNLELVGLGERAWGKFSTYSLGMKQRLAIASAMLNNPEILILDEPTNGLDPQGIHQIRKLIIEIAGRGTTILLASHLLDEVEKVCSHVVILRKGEKLYSGRVDTMTASYGFFELGCADNAALAYLLKQNAAFGEVSSENGRLRALLTREMSADDLNRWAFENKIVLTHLVKRRESLEEQFLSLTQ